MKSLHIAVGREAYSPKDIGHTMTVGDLIDFLQEYDEDAKVFLSNDNGYAFCHIGYDSFTEHNDEEKEDEKDEETDL